MEHTSDLRMIAAASVLALVAMLPLNAATAGSAGPGHSAPARQLSDCGPELTAPVGVEARTCVLTDGRGTWARTYYRNTSGIPLAAAVTLTRPGDRTLVIHCALPAADGPGVCQTPRATASSDTAGGRAATRKYEATARIASPSGGRLVLRAGT